MGTLFNNLPVNHKRGKKYAWTRLGIVFSSEEEFDEIYQRYLNTSVCELCKKPFTDRRQIQADHEHVSHKEGKYWFGHFRNFICGSCNQRRADNKMDRRNKTGCRNMTKVFHPTSKQGYLYRFYAFKDGKRTAIKASTNKEKLRDYIEKWTEENNYYR